MKDFDVNAHLAEALRSADEHDLPDELLREWEPTECLGKSELSETLLVRHRTTGKQAVVKLLGTQMPEVHLLDTLQVLEHPSLPKILQVIHGKEKVCVLRAYIEGESVADLAAQRPFSESDTVRIGVMLCDVLQYLHSQTPPIIHRDVKPENIIIQPDGVPVLIDFGIARLQNNEAEADTRVMGTQRFAPPEQYGFQQTDARSDIYALGVVLGWMLTGSVQSKDHDLAIQNKALGKIIRKCTAFSPADRYASAQEVKRDLLRYNRPRYRGLVAALAACLICIVAGIAAWQMRQAPIVFTEPMIERSVRQTLGVAADAPLTAEQLAAVDGLYIFGDAIAANQDGFYAAAGNWYSSDTKAHGPIASLEDVKLLPNLRFVMIAANHITDISPLAALTNLEKVEFKHNSISDITPLKGLPQLGYVGLNDNPMTDVSALSTLPNLRYLDLCDASAYDPAGLDGLGDMEQLNISNRTDSWRHLGTQRVRDLRLGWTGIDTLGAISEITGLEHLEIEHTRIASLASIEAYQELTYLRMSGCEIADLSPLLTLPRLETLVIDEARRQDVEALGASFDVQYE